MMMLTSSSLCRSARLALATTTVSLSVAACDPALSKKDFVPLSVTRNEQLSKNVHKVTLAFPNPTDTLGMTCAGMLMVQGPKRDGSGNTARPYTPVTRDDTVGSMELVVKDYPGVGNVASHICALKVGDSLDVKGCYTKIAVTANKWKRVGLVAGGSGLTPCLQVAEELLSHADDTTSIDLIFANRNEEEIFLKDRLDALAAASGGRFRVHYCVDAGSAAWTGLTGYVTKEMVAAHLPPPGAGAMIMVCGPPPMYKAICGPKLFEKGKPPKQGDVAGILKELGFTADMVFKF